MTNGNHQAHIISCFKAYGFFVYQCTDIFQIQLGFIALNKNISVLGNVLEIKGKEFDIKKDIKKEQIENLSSVKDKAQSVGIVVFSKETDCYHYLPIELIEKAIEMRIRFITITSTNLFSKALETWRNNVNANV